jgi:hypothetical protein
VPAAQSSGLWAAGQRNLHRPTVSATERSESAETAFSAAPCNRQLLNPYFDLPHRWKHPRPRRISHEELRL